MSIRHNNIVTPDETYIINWILAESNYSVVFAGRRARDNLPVAIKQVSKENIVYWEYLDGHLDGPRKPIEVCVLEKLDGIPAGVVKLLDWIDKEHLIYIITSRPETSMTLFQYIYQNGALDDHLSRWFFQQIVQSVIACFKAGVIHRDLKAENIIVDTKTLKLILIDFGSAGYYLKNTMYTDLNGTRKFYPPEWYRDKKYDGESATVWTLGILLYHMLMADLPFHTIDQILTANVQFNRKITQKSKQLIQKCLSLDPSKRPLLLDILNSPWLNPPWLNTDN